MYRFSSDAYTCVRRALTPVLVITRKDVSESSFLAHTDKVMVEDLTEG
jgi:hypothetical protein